MENKERLVRHLKKMRTNMFFARLIKVVLLLAFVVLMPFVIYEKIIAKDLLSVVFFIIAEVILIIVTVVLIKSASEVYGLKNSRIYQCIENSSAITEIIITPEKILFEIKGMEDETLYIKESKYKSLLIINIKEVFGEEKIVKNY
jgi:hypothetical protein